MSARSSRGGRSLVPCHHKRDMVSVSVVAFAAANAQLAVLAHNARDARAGTIARSPLSWRWLVAYRRGSGVHRFFRATIRRGLTGPGSGRLTDSLHPEYHWRAALGRFRNDSQ